MSTEIEKFLFDQMVEYINDISRFVTDVGQNKIRKASEVRNRLMEIYDDSKTFAARLDNIGKTGAGGASARSVAGQGFKTKMKKMVKTSDAIRRGVDQGEINLTQFRAQVKQHIVPLAKEFAAHGAKFTPSGVTEEEMSKELKFMSNKKGHKAALNVLRSAVKAKKTEESEDHDPDMHENVRRKADDKEAAKLISGYKGKKNKLPSSLRGRMFSLVQMPVVPFMDFKLMTPKFLRTSGIDFQFIAESFIVLEDQYLLAFDNDSVKEFQAEKKHKKTSSVNKKKVQRRNAQEDFVIEILERINKTANEEYTLVTSHFEHHPTNGRIVFAWIMPVRTHRIFARNGDMQDALWGFPWSREATAVL